MSRNVITIDGPAGSGKSTAARRLAVALGWRYLDTGAMYRGMTLALLRRLRERASAASDRDVEQTALALDAGDVESLLAATELQPVARTDGATDMTLDGQPVPDVDLRAPHVARAIKVVADNVAIRQRLIALQQQVGEAGELVTEGRDQGSVVFPDARFKFFITASIEERARRRLEEFGLRGLKADGETVIRDVATRDRADETRRFGRLVRPADAITIDTTGLDPDGVVQTLLAIIRDRLTAAGEPLPERLREPTNSNPAASDSA